MKQKICLFLVGFLVFIGFTHTSKAQELLIPETTTYRAVVTEVVEVIGTGIFFQGGEEVKTQEIKAKILTGEQKGDIIMIGDDFLMMNEGDTFFGLHTIYNGQATYGVLDYDRRSGLTWLFIIFVILIIGLGKWQGVRSLVSLGGSLAVIILVLIPLLLSGAPPILTSVGLASIILAIAIFFTHGFTRYSAIAFVGTSITVIITGILASFVVYSAHLTGFASDESTYLNFNTGGSLDFVGLLIAGMIIGILGVLDDIAITQVAVVRELYGANANLTKKQIFQSALRVGKEHVSALVNTLVLAYVGVSLPLLLYFSSAGSGNTVMTINSEIFATEIIRTILGSIGLILTVPLTTLLAVMFLDDTRGKTTEDENIPHACAGHSH